jgi:hypothetical protein
MKKIWIIFALVVIIAAQVTFIYSSRNTSVHSSVTGTSAVVISKLKYTYMRATIHIHRSGFDSDVIITFPNGTQQEIFHKLSPEEKRTGKFDFDFTFTVILPRSGDFLGDYNFFTFLDSDPSFWVNGSTLSLSRNHPIDVAVVPKFSDNFLRWYYDDKHTFDRDHSKYIDIYWFKIQGNASLNIVGSGVAI